MKANIRFGTNFNEVNKTTPIKNRRQTFKKRKDKYQVDLDGERYETFAHSEAGAISNAAFRYADKTGEPVALVMWKIKNDVLFCDVERIVINPRFSSVSDDTDYN